MKSFKEWLVKETPDSVTTPSGSQLKWNTGGQTFFIFSGGYSIYTESGQYTHDEIIFALKRMFPVYNKHGAIVNYADYFKEKGLADIDKEIKASVFIASQTQVRLLSHGQINENAWNQILRMINVSKKSKSRSIYVGGRNSNHEIEGIPEIILGRIWKSEKIVSFWNNQIDIQKQLQNILNFVTAFGNPSDYKYDVRLWADHKLIDYEEFTASIKKDTSSVNYPPAKAS